MSRKREKLGYTRETQKLMYWFFPCFAEYWGESPEYAKNRLQELFLQEYELYPEENALKYILGVLYDKDKLSYSGIVKRVFKAIQELLKTKGRFSTALYMLTQKQANDFISFMFDLALKNGVELRKELLDLFQKQLDERFIWTTLVNRKCCICGEVGDLHHYDQVGSFGYNSDLGTNYRYMCLCRKHHTEIHSIGRIEFTKKYTLRGIYIKNKQIEKLKNVYPSWYKKVIENRKREELKERE